MATHNEKMLEAVQAKILERVTADVDSYQDGDLGVNKIPMQQLMDMEKRYQLLVNEERRAAKIQQGLKNPNIIKVRFV